MTESEVLYMKGMDMSESEDEDFEVEDIWDDRKLNEAYDKALKIANAEVAKRLAMSTNTQHKEDNSNKKKDKQVSQQSGNAKKEAKTQWKAGMACRAVYEGDGLEYEAFLLRIINEKECIVRFLGYENSEIVCIDSLKPTLGKEVRTRQIEEAFHEKEDDGFASQSPNAEKMEYGTASPLSTEKSFRQKKKNPKKNKAAKNTNRNTFEFPEMPNPMANMAMFQNFGSMDLPIPPPPPINLCSGRVDSEDQAMSSMLLSWYMSGYYAGLYQGLRRSREGR